MQRYTPIYSFQLSSLHHPKKACVKWTVREREHQSALITSNSVALAVQSFYPPNFPPALLYWVITAPSAIPGPALAAFSPPSIQSRKTFSQNFHSAWRSNLNFTSVYHFHIWHSLYRKSNVALWSASSIVIPTLRSRETVMISAQSTRNQLNHFRVFSSGMSFFARWKTICVAGSSNL